MHFYGNCLTFVSFFSFSFVCVVFGLDSSLPLFPPGMDPSKLYNPLLEMSDPRAMHPNPHGPYLKKKSKRKYYISFAYGFLVIDFILRHFFVVD